MTDMIITECAKCGRRIPPASYEDKTKWFCLECRDGAQKELDEVASLVQNWTNRGRRIKEEKIITVCTLCGHRFIGWKEDRFCSLCRNKKEGEKTVFDYIDQVIFEAGNEEIAEEARKLKNRLIICSCDTEEDIWDSLKALGKAKRQMMEGKR